MRSKGSFCGIAMVALSMAAAVCGAAAQTTVTETGGAANSVPVFTSASAVKSSVITQSGSNVGIGTTTPSQKLSVSQGSLNYGFVSSYRGPLNNYTNLFFGGAITDDGNGNYTVQTDGGSNYFAAIRMDNTGGSAGAINFYTAPTTGGTSYQLTDAQFANYLRMTLIGNRVGIGTSAPASALHVSGNSDQVITLQSTTPGNPWVAFSNTVGVYTNQMDSATGGLYWWNGGTRTMNLAQNGNLTLTGSVTYADNTTQSTAWTGVLCGGDYSESVDVSGDRKNYAAGDVLVIDPQEAGSFLKSAEPYSTAVTGIYATKPGVVGRRQKTDPKTSTTEVPMAMIGIVPTRVSAENGPIRPGDLLVTSATLGYAMKGTDRTRMLGAVIGKALGSLDSGTGMIEAVVTLQ